MREAIDGEDGAVLDDEVDGAGGVKAGTPGERPAEAGTAGDPDQALAGPAVGDVPGEAFDVAADGVIAGYVHGALLTNLYMHGRSNCIFCQMRLTFGKHLTHGEVDAKVLVMKSKRVPVGKLGTLSQGLTLTRYTSDDGQERRVLQVTNLAGIHVEPKDGDRFEKFDDARLGDFLTRTGQVLIALRTSALKASVVPDSLQGAVISNSLTILEVDEAVVNPYFIAALLRSEVMQRVVAPMFTGTAIQGIPLAKFKTLEITLPDLATQNAIAEAIAAQDAYREEADKVAALMRERIDATLRPLVTKEARWHDA